MKGNGIDKSSLKEKAPELAARWGWSALHLNVNVIMRLAVWLTSDKILVNHYHQHLVTQLIIKEDEVEDSKQFGTIRKKKSSYYFLSSKRKYRRARCCDNIYNLQASCM